MIFIIVGLISINIRVILFKSCLYKRSLLMAFILAPLFLKRPSGIKGQLHQMSLNYLKEPLISPGDMLLCPFTVKDTSILQFTVSHIIHVSV